MIKLRKIIEQLTDSVYQKLEDSLTRTRADNFLFLLQSYRENVLGDEEIAKRLRINSNSFYVLKSRLHDRIQDQLSGDIHASREEVTRQLHKVPEMCYGTSREVAAAFLQKLEKDLLFYDMHNELMVVYSALKQIHLFSDKYFHYSQLYNRHMAFSMSLEKSNELLGNFNLSLAQYNFSRNQTQLDKLKFLKRGISDHYNLNPSRQVEIIRNIIDLQLAIFCAIPSGENDTEQLLRRTQKLMEDLPQSSPVKQWLIVSDLLHFEYYYRMKMRNQAAILLERLLPQQHKILLYSNVCLAGSFLLSSLDFMETEKLHFFTEGELLMDQDDMHSRVMLDIRNAFLLHKRGQTRDAATQLNNTLSEHTFKDLLHIAMEIRLALGYYYVVLEEFELAENVLKNLARKLKSEDPDRYANILQLIKVLLLLIKNPDNKNSSKTRDLFDLFLARNNNEVKLSDYLVNDLRRMLQI